jgi:TRAP-type transport system periplasmic protein
MQKRQRLLAVTVSLAIILILTIFAACAPAAPPSSPTPAATPTPAPAQPIAMRFASHQVTMHVQHTALMAPWCSEVEKQTNGRLKVTLFPAEALGKGNQNYDLLASGGVDIASIPIGYTPGRYPLTESTLLPFMNPPDRCIGACWDLYRQFPEIQKEWDPVKVIGITSTDPIQLYTAKKPIRTLDDLKGMQIRVHNQSAGDLFKALGASPVIIPIMDTYIQLEKGTIDGALATLEASKPYKLPEVCKYVTLLGLSISPTGFGFNAASWNKLPPDVQQLLGPDGALGGDWWTKQNVVAYNKAMDDASAYLKAGGVEIITLPPAEMTKLKAAGQVTVDQWLAATNAKGLPAQKIYDGLANILKTKYNY